MAFAPTSDDCQARDNTIALVCGMQSELASALLSGDGKLAVDLVQRGADWRGLVQETHNTSLLHELIAAGDLSMLRVIDRLDPCMPWEPTSAPFRYLPLLYYSVCANQLDIAEFLLTRRCPVDINRVRREVNTALDRAVEGDDIEMVRLLLSHGADVTLRGRSEGAPLRGAVYNGNVTIAQMLIEAGALNDPDAKYSLSMSIELGNIQITRLLLSHGVEYPCPHPAIRWVRYPDSLLFKCVRRNDRAMVHLLITEGCIDMREEARNPALLTCAIANDEQLLVQLLTQAAQM